MGKVSTNKIKASYFIGIDGGATNSRAIFGSTNDGVKAHITGGAANICLSLEGARKEILKISKEAIVSAGCKVETVLPRLLVCAGVAGGEREEVKREFLNQAWPFQKFVVVHDSVVALEGALLGDDGALVILGTGISAYYRSAGRKEHLSGWGFPFDDIGSGAWLGQQALQIAIRSDTGLLSPSALAQRVMERFALDPESLIAFTRSADSGAFAKFAPLVWDLANKGDPQASELIRRSVREVEDLLQLMQKKGARRFTIVGGMSEAVRPWLSHTWQKLCEPPALSPVEGAYRLAKNYISSSA